MWFANLHAYLTSFFSNAGMSDQWAEAVGFASSLSLLGFAAYVGIVIFATITYIIAAKWDG